VYKIVRFQVVTAVSMKRAETSTKCNNPEDSNLCTKFWLENLKEEISWKT
jgi:hypothetical protein